MYFYTISDGEWSDYSFTIIYHKKKFTNKEFAQMYNQAVSALGDRCSFCDEVAEKMEEMFGFKIVNNAFEINRGFGVHKPVNIDDIREDERYFTYNE
jgi:hypothetical protein